jgi:Fe-S oxidoreductase/nitrate reductase gamma subunit
VPTRTEFLFQGPLAKAMFYLLIAAAMAAFAWQVWGRVRLWRLGRPIAWEPDYFGGIIKYALGQRKVRTSRPRSGSPMHVLIFYGFLTLFIGTTLLGINTYSPWKFHHGAYYLTYEFVLDVMGLALIAGLVWALVRRAMFRPRSMTSTPPDFLALALLLLLAVTGFAVEGARMSADPKPFDTSAPVGHWVATLMPGVSPGVYVGIWWFHAALVAVFIVAVPRMRLRHIAYAIFSTAGADPELKMGQLAKISLEEVEQTGKIGVEVARDYSRWHLMSLDACMECGRCTEACPAWRVGKVLNPKEVVQSIRISQETGAPVAEAVSEDALWQCTTCNACVEACPVLIRHVDLIVDARRYLVAEGRVRGSSATMLRQLQSAESSWGTPAAEREKWMEGREIPLARDLIGKGEKFDVLLWVGCAGAVDRAAMRTTQEFASLLKKAGVAFACLGSEERCTGDSARRTGDEFLFQQMAELNIATFAQYGVKTIVAACPHCFNTLKNEYPAFGGNYEVVHHTQFLQRLIADGKLNAPKFEAGSVALHDPCYLARINGEADAPRAALGVASAFNDSQTPVAQWLNAPMEKGNTLAEPRGHAQKTLCCGAGGGRMWMDEDTDKRPSDARMKELIATGAKTVAVACPFCRIMLETGAGSDQVNLVDIAELVGKAN